ncbi:MAG: GRAM domain-containing protein, partial [Bacteroidia bacterium]
MKYLFQIEHYSCACKLESDLMLRHGRMFLSEHHICFSSHIIDSYI